MKFSLFLSIPILFLAACSDGLVSEPIAPAPEEAPVYVHFDNVMDGDSLVLSTATYKNGYETPFTVNTLKYYISGVTLNRTNLPAYLALNYDLIDASVPESQIITLKDVPNGTYESLSFALGIDQERNHTGDQSGDLDPVNGMLWIWKTGYIFLKHEGLYTDSTGAQKMISFHYATDPAYTTITLPITSFEIKGEERHIHVAFDLNKVYKSEPKMDFAVNNFRHSERGDEQWLTTMRENLPNGFSIRSIK